MGKESKTVREWISELDEPYRSQAMKYDNVRFDSKAGNLWHAIMLAFKWGDAIEGWHHWCDLADQFYDLVPTIPDKAHPNSIDALEKVGTFDHKSKVFHFIRTQGPITRQDLSSKLYLPINIICGRVNELIKDDLIEEDGFVKVELSGRLYKRSLLCIKDRV